MGRSTGRGAIRRPSDAAIRLVRPIARNQRHQAVNRRGTTYGNAWLVVAQYRWTHTFTALCLSDDELAAILDNAGFRQVQWLTADHSWLVSAAA